jgi:hypothetical protein
MIDNNSVTNLPLFFQYIFLEKFLALLIIYALRLYNVYMLTIEETSN